MITVADTSRITERGGGGGGGGQNFSTCMPSVCIESFKYNAWYIKFIVFKVIKITVR